LSKVTILNTGASNGGSGLSNTISQA